MTKIKPEKRDMDLVARLFPDRGPTPLAFRLGRKEFFGVPEALHPVTQEKWTDSAIRDTIVTGKSGSVEVRIEIRTYQDFPVIEWQAFFENRGKKPSPVLSGLRAADLLLPAKKGVLHHGNGETKNESGFAFRDERIGTEPITLAPLHGLSSEGAFPFFRIRTEQYIASVAVGWSGAWQASIQKEAGGIRLTAGQKRLHAKILPGETLCSPRMTVLLTAGPDRDRAVNLWRAWYFRHVLPTVGGQSLPPKACMHLFRDNGPEFTGTTEASQLQSLKQYIDRGLKPDLWWIDAGWYPCDGVWGHLGTWEADRTRFPDGLLPIGKLCEENDVDFLLWFEPERVTEGTWLYRHRQKWLLHQKDPAEPDGILRAYSLFNLGDPEACRWLTDHVDRLIKEWHVTVYRQDFNRVDALRVWEDNETKDRIGALENRHVQGYWKYWDELRLRNPGLWIDCCASGGRRNDLETLRRAVPLHYTDIGYGNHPIKQFQHQAMFEWIPYFRAHTRSWDNEKGGYEPRTEHAVCDAFSYFNAMTPAVTVMTRYDADEAEFALGRKFLPIWRRAAELELRGDYYPLIPSRKSPRDLTASEFSDPDRGDGFFLVIRNTRCPLERCSVSLHTDPLADYLVEDPVSKEKTVISGAALAEGYPLSLPRRSGAIRFYQKIVK